MTDRSGISGQFEERDLYRDWLRRRQAWPMRLDRVMMPWLWGLVGLLLLGFVFIIWIEPMAHSFEVVTYFAGVSLGAVVARRINRRRAQPLKLHRNALIWLWVIVCLFLVAWAATAVIPTRYVLSIGRRDYAVGVGPLIAGIAAGAAIYLQRLSLRDDWRRRADRITGPWLRRMATLFLVLWALMLTGYETEIIGWAALVTSGVIIFALPAVLVFVDFLVHLPRCVHSDTNRGMMQAIFITPVPTSEIVEGLRRWAVALNLRHLAPSGTLLVGLLALTMMGVFPPWSSLRDLAVILLTCLPFAGFLFSIWLFLLGVGLVSAAMPSWLAKGGLWLVLCVIPVFIGVFWGAAVLAILTCEEIFSLRMGYTGYGPPPLCFFGYYIALLMIPIRLARVWAPRLMEMRRQGRWS